MTAKALLDELQETDPAEPYDIQALPTKAVSR
jgi:hypothetical protein